MATVYKAQLGISAVFKDQKQIDDVIRRLLDRGVPRDHISVMGRNFQSETRIAGFITPGSLIFLRVSKISIPKDIFPKMSKSYYWFDSTTFNWFASLDSF